MKIFQFIRFLKAIVNTIFGRGAILLLPFLPAVASCQHSAFFNAGDPFLLDIAPGAKTAFSVRQLSSTYTGSAVEVRRASDNATQNIGFEGGQINLSALTSFCSGTDCFVKTWYDQSGNGNHATQTTAANQPKIWDSSTGVILDNGKPAIDFDGTDYLISNYSQLFATTTDNIFLTNVLTFTDTATVQVPFRSSTGNATVSENQNTIIVGYTSPNVAFYRVNLDTGLGLATTIGTEFGFNQNLVSLQKNGSTGNAYKNGSLVAAAATNNVLEGNIPINTLYKLYIGINGGFGITVSTVNFTGTMKELIIYNSSQTTNRLAIETNVNNFFSIY